MMGPGEDDLKLLALVDKGELDYEEHLRQTGDPGDLPMPAETDSPD